MKLKIFAKRQFINIKNGRIFILMILRKFDAIPLFINVYFSIQKWFRKNHINFDC